MDRNTGKPLDGWAHVEQSLGVVLTTALASRVMRRNFGSNLPRLVDAPISPASVVDFYAATAGAIAKDEPRFRPVRMTMGGVPAEGTLTIDCEGVYFPRGHLGDFSTSEPKKVSVPL